MLHPKEHPQWMHDLTSELVEAMDEAMAAVIDEREVRSEEDEAAEIMCCYSALLSLFADIVLEIEELEGDEHKRELTLEMAKLTRRLVDEFRTRMN